MACNSVVPFSKTWCAPIYAIQILSLETVVCSVFKEISASLKQPMLSDSRFPFLLVIGEVSEWILYGSCSGSAYFNNMRIHALQSKTKVEGESWYQKIKQQFFNHFRRGWIICTGCGKKDESVFSSHGPHLPYISYTKLHPNLLKQPHIFFFFCEVGKPIHQRGMTVNKLTKRYVDSFLIMQSFVVIFSSDGKTYTTKAKNDDLVIVYNELSDLCNCSSQVL